MMKRLFAVVSLLGLMQGAALALVPAGVGCAPTAEAAVARLLAHATSLPMEQGGFKVVSVRRDPLRKTAWALVQSCAEPARPMTAIALGESLDLADGLSVAGGVKIGERVSVIDQAADSRMRLTGISRDSGAADAVVHVELPRFSEDDTTPAPVIRCRVLDAGLVEILR